MRYKRLCASLTSAALAFSLLPAQGLAEAMGEAGPPTGGQSLAGEQLVEQTIRLRSMRDDVDTSFVTDFIESMDAVLESDDLTYDAYAAKYARAAAPAADAPAAAPAAAAPAATAPAAASAEEEGDDD